jgi:hypothetical protein
VQDVFLTVPYSVKVIASGGLERKRSVAGLFFRQSVFLREPTSTTHNLPNAKSARRVSKGLLALLAPCWVGDLEISLAEEEAVSGPICPASPGGAVPRFLRAFSQSVLS